MCVYTHYSHGENVTRKDALINNHSTDFYIIISRLIFLFLLIFLLFLLLSSLPENTNLLIRLFLSAVGVVVLETGVVPVFWSD